MNADLGFDPRVFSGRAPRRRNQETAEMSALLSDLRQALRALRVARGFTATATVTLALGIGANATLFSILHAVLLRPLPYPEADRLAVAPLSLPDFEDVRERSHTFEDAAVWGSNRYDVPFGGEAESLQGAIVSPRFFPMLGPAGIGRTFRPDEDQEPVAVISHRLWQRRYGGTHDVLGRSIELVDRPHTIVGVMGAEFEYPGRTFDVWSPLGSAMSRTPEQARNRGLRIFRAVLRLKPGVTAEAAQADLDRVSSALAAENPETNAGFEIRATPLRDLLLGPVRGSLLALMGAVGLVLLVTCFNVANLCLTRATTRTRELAVRRALGATSGRIARELLAEGAVLAGLGLLAGLVVATWATAGVRRLGPRTFPRLEHVGVDLTVLVFAALVSGAALVVFGLVPALASARADLLPALRSGERGSTRSGGRLRHWLAVGELAMSLVVLTGAGLLGRSLHALLHVDPGFVSEGLVTAGLGLWRYEGPARRIAVLQSVLERLRQVPGVDVVGSGTGLPPETAQRATGFEVRELAENDPAQRAYFIAVSPDYFRALGARLLEGRVFGEEDGPNGEKVVIVNRALARRLFGEAGALGKHVRLRNPEQTPDWREVVGVVADVRYAGLDAEGEAAIYTPFAQTPFIFAYAFVRNALPEGAAVDAIRRAIGDVDPRLASSRVIAMADLVAGTVAGPRFNLTLLSAFAFLALALAAVGTYGVVSYGVAQRTREIGLRMALGARPSQVLASVVGQGLGLAAAGVALGLAGSFAAARLMEGLLYGVTATDPAALAGAAAVLTLVALGAAYLPGRRATRVDPAAVLRAE
jgi:putative ABC transport system permease protein